MYPFPSDEARENHSLISRFKNFLNIWKVKKYPSFSQFRQFLKILKKREKITFFVFLSLFLASFLSLFLIIYFKNTESRPASGGDFVQGVVGQPRFINPIYSAASDVDQDLTQLIFSGLLKYDEHSKIVTDLAEKYEVKEGDRVYEVYLKENLFWSDGQPLTADDVIFTINTIQNSNYKSPQIARWIGVEVEKISDLGIKFSLKNPYNSFLENLTQGIIPQHIWKNIDSQNFPLAIYNLKSIGSGPYKLKDYKQDDLGRIISLELVRNQRYFGKVPYLSKIFFHFFDTEEELIKAAQEKEIEGLSISDPSSFKQFQKTDFQNISFYMSRYFAVFFNPDKSEVLSDLNVRQALNYGTNKSELIEEVLLGYGTEISSPILPAVYGFSEPTKIYSFNLETAKSLLEKAGFVENEEGFREKALKKTPAFQFKTNLKEGSTGKEVEALQQCLAKDPAVYPEGRVTGEFGSQTKKAVILFQEKYAEDILKPFGLTEGTGLVQKATRDKLNQICFPPPQESLPLKFSLTTVNQPFLVQTANLLKEQWKTLGVEIEIKTYESSEIENVIKTRDYESLLFGEVLGGVPDPFPYWHSTQRKDPGLNIAVYQNKTADKLLEEIRQISSETERKQKLEQFQNILNEDSPAVFLYNLDYVYLVSKKMRGVEGGFIADPSDRFTNIENWYTNIKKAWK